MAEDTVIIWGCSSAGRAPALQAGGQRFEPAHLHQSPLNGNVLAGRPTERHSEHKGHGLIAQVVRAHA